jgi:hypothetical protein
MFTQSTAGLPSESELKPGYARGGFTRSICNKTLFYDCKSKLEENEN